MFKLKNKGFLIIKRIFNLMPIFYFFCFSQQNEYSLNWCKFLKKNFFAPECPLDFFVGWCEKEIKKYVNQCKIIFAQTDSCHPMPTCLPTAWRCATRRVPRDARWSMRPAEDLPLWSNWFLDVLHSENYMQLFHCFWRPLGLHISVSSYLCVKIAELRQQQGG